MQFRAHRRSPTVAHLAGPQLLDRILTQLPTGYALLFGRDALTQAPQAVSSNGLE